MNKSYTILLCLLLSCSIIFILVGDTIDLSNEEEQILADDGNSFVSVGTSDYNRTTIFTAPTQAQPRSSTPEAIVIETIEVEAYGPQIIQLVVNNAQLERLSRCQVIQQTAQSFRSDIRKYGPCFCCYIDSSSQLENITQPQVYECRYRTNVCCCIASCPCMVVATPAILVLCSCNQWCNGEACCCID